MGMCPECYGKKNPFFELEGSVSDDPGGLLVLDLDPETLEQVEKERKSAQEKVC